MQETNLAGRVLVVDDDRDMCELVQDGLSSRHFHVAWTTDADSALESLRENDFDVVLTDVKLAGTDGLTLCERLTQQRPDLTVIVMTAFGSMESAIAAIRAGAYDFINKPVEMESLALSVERALQHKRLRDEIRRLRNSDERQQRGIPGIVGESPAMLAVYDLIQRLGNTDVSVLITGESGTGKELVAEALHRRSDRREGPFVVINCAAVPANLLESELFGHMRGAFTDARATRKGLFQQAENGTLFLDEIGELPMDMQPKLLRVLQTQKVRPVGGNVELDVNCRIVAATNRDLEEEIKKGTFREDLFYRVNVVPIHMPPLRARGNDVLMLAQFFVEHLASRVGKEVRGISSEAARKLLEYEWPGNVRELENTIERAVILTRFDHIMLEDLPEKIRRYESSQWIIGGDDPAHFPSLDELERRYIRRVLQAVGGNKAQAARILGLDRRTLYRKLERYAQETAVA